jgi:phosphopantetheine--protein transferase-like protein
MLLGIGVDIIKISRIRDAVENSGKVFLDEVFTEWEQKRAQSHHDSAAYLAMTFAGKEAIFKCFGIGWETGVRLREIEIRMATSESLTRYSAENSPVSPATVAWPRLS